MGRVVRCVHIISNKISYDRIQPKNWQQRRCPTSRTSSCSFFGDTRLAGVSSLSLLSLLCCRCRVGAVKFAHYHLRLFKLKTDTRAFGGIKNVRKKRGHIFHTIFTTRPSLKSFCRCLFRYATLINPSFFYRNIDRSDMMCHESKTHVLVYA